MNYNLSYLVCSYSEKYDTTVSLILHPDPPHPYLSIYFLN